MFDLHDVTTCGSMTSLPCGRTYVHAMAEQQAGQSVQHSFQVPKRLVKTPEDLDKWPTSQVVAEYSQKIK